MEDLFVNTKWSRDYLEIAPPVRIPASGKMTCRMKALFTLFSKSMPYPEQKIEADLFP